MEWQMFETRVPENMKLKEVLFDPPIKDKRGNMNSKLYLGVSGKKKEQRQLFLKDGSKEEYTLEMRYFENEETPGQIYKRAIKLMKKYGQETGELPGGLLDELFS